jgi:hypothetical protein
MNLKPELERAVRRHRQWFGSYKKSGEMNKTQVWLTVKDGCIEFLTPNDSYKAKRVRLNPHVVCFVGSENGPAISGTAEIITDRESILRVYGAYWKVHPILMIFLFSGIRKRIRAGTQVVIRVRPDDANVLAGITDPPL